MATTKKKKRKSTSTSAGGSVSSAPQKQSDQIEQNAVTDSTTAATNDEATNEGFRDEYGYVRKDLRHLAIISVVLFAVMLGIGFFI